MSRLLSLTLLAALAFTLLSACSASAGRPRATASSSTARPFFGFNDHAAMWGQLTPDADARLAKQAGATVHRLTFNWSAAERTPGQWVWTRYDAMYQADVAAGIKPIFQLMFAPTWARDPSIACTGDCRYPPDAAHLSAFGAAAAKIATRYPKSAAIEIWNEPNDDVFWQSGPDPEYYARMLRVAHDAVRAAGSPLPVLGGSLSSHASSSDGVIDYATFLRRMYAAGAKGAMDGISLHAYPHQVDFGYAYRELTMVREIRDAAGDGVPLWVSEIGYSGATDVQSYLLQALVQRMKAMPDVRAVIVHSMVALDFNGSFDPYGAVLGDGTPRPVYCALAALQGSGYACPSGSQPPPAPQAQQLRWAAQDMLQRAADAARSYRRSKGSYTGLDAPGALHAIDSALAARQPTSAEQAAAPGPAADPSLIAVYVMNPDIVELCNTSQADHSYCILTQYGRSWTYGTAAGSIYAAAGALNNGASTTW